MHATKPEKTEPTNPDKSSCLAPLPAITPASLIALLVAAIVWAWSAVVVISRQYIVYQYRVKEIADAGISVYVICAIGACVLLGVLIFSAGRSAAATRRTACWLAAAGIITIMDIARAAGCPVMPGFWEAIWLAFVTGMAIRSALVNVLTKAPESVVQPPPAGHDNAHSRAAVLHINRCLALLIVLVAATTMGIWWHIQGCLAYDNFLMSYSDFALVGQRIVNTWRGEGFLWHDSFRPTFFDHFDPALVGLVPLWGLWPDPRLFMAVQAVCLATPAVFVYLIARRIGSSPWTSAAWALGYLALPAVGQLNLSLLYGWHPISLALPALTACLYALICRRRVTAAILALAACCVEETVMPVLVSMCAAFAVQAWLADRKRTGPATQTAVEHAGGAPTPYNIWPGGNLRPWGWLIAAAIFAAMFLIVTKLTPMGRFQTQGKFAHLGDGPLAILLSPVLRPDAFWGQVLSGDSLYFTACLLVPAGMAALLRGWPMLIAAAPPLAVVLAMEYSGAKCLGFWYGTLLLPIIAVSAMLGCAGGPAGETKPNLLPAGAAAMLAAALTASMAFGDLPLRPYQPSRVSPEKSAAWEKRNAVINETIALAADKNSSVLATSNIAAHLLGVKRLSVVRDASLYRDEFAKEAGDKNWIGLFDWVILDLQDRFQQDEPDMRRAAMAAETAGFRLIFARNGALAYRRPQATASDIADPLAAWRVPTPDKSARPAPLNGELEIADLNFQPQFDSSAGFWTIRGLFILTARTDRPKEYWIEITAMLGDGRQVAKSGPIVPAGGNRPTSWWRAGESYRDSFALRLPTGVDLRQVKIEANAISATDLFDSQPGRRDPPKGAGR